MCRHERERRKAVAAEADRLASEPGAYRSNTSPYKRSALHAPRTTSNLAAARSSGVFHPVRGGLVFWVGLSTPQLSMRKNAVRIFLE
jgi:hypothetical protein